MQRRKFFTFVSLFGISITLTVLMVVVSFLDHLVSPNVPETKRDRSLYLLSVVMTDNDRQGYSQNPPGFHLVNEFAKKLKTPEKVSMFSIFETANAFSNNQKLSLDFRYTDAEYWEILDFEFVEGKPFTQKELDDRAYSVVISRSTRDNYFGKRESAIGKFIETNGEQYRVIGVVEDVPITNIHAHGDIFAPYTISPIDLSKSRNLSGNYFAIVLAKDKGDFPTIQQEFQDMVTKIHLKDYHDFDNLKTHLDTFLGSFTRPLFGGDQEDKGDQAHVFYLFAGFFMFLFMLLPAVNLVNLNITRIMERASEIGVRKAFGASNQHLLGQFLIENVAVTIIGGVIGMVLAFVVLGMINASHIIPHVHLTFNTNVFLIGLGISLFFGIMSGVYPAFRMSKLQAASALKGTK